MPTSHPSGKPSSHPSVRPSVSPSNRPSHAPNSSPTSRPSSLPTSQPSLTPISKPTAIPTSLYMLNSSEIIAYLSVDQMFIGATPSQLAASESVFKRTLMTLFRKQGYTQILLNVTAVVSKSSHGSSGTLSDGATSAIQVSYTLIFAVPHLSELTTVATDLTNTLNQSVYDGEFNQQFHSLCMSASSSGCAMANSRTTGVSIQGPTILSLPSQFRTDAPTVGPTSSPANSGSSANGQSSSFGSINSYIPYIALAVVVLLVVVVFLYLRRKNLNRESESSEFDEVDLKFQYGHKGPKGGYNPYYEDSKGGARSPVKRVKSPPRDGKKSKADRFKAPNMDFAFGFDEKQAGRGHNPLYEDTQGGARSPVQRVKSPPKKKKKVKLMVDMPKHAKRSGRQRDYEDDDDIGGDYDPEQFEYNVADIYKQRDSNTNYFDYKSPGYNMRDKLAYTNASSKQRMLSLDSREVSAGSKQSSQRSMDSKMIELANRGDKKLYVQSRPDIRSPSRDDRSDRSNSTGSKSSRHLPTASSARMMSPQKHQSKQGTYPPSQQREMRQQKSPRQQQMRQLQVKNAGQMPYNRGSDVSSDELSGSDSE